MRKRWRLTDSMHDLIHMNRHQRDLDIVQQMLDADV